MKFAIPFFNLLVALGVFLAVVLLIILSFYPSGERKKKRQRNPEELENIKDWEAACHRLEKYIVNLKNDIATLQKTEKANLKELEQEKTKYNKLAERLTQEKGWREKEQSSFSKINNETEQLKRELIAAEQNLEKKHGHTLKIERDLKDTKFELEKIVIEKRSLVTQVATLETSLKQFRGELLELKKANAELVKKSDESNWVAQAEYDRVSKLLKEKDKELQRVLREGNRL